MTSTRLIVIDLFTDAEELDVIGPWEVLASWTQSFPEDGWRVVLASDDGLPRACAKGLTLSPTATLPDLDRIDLFVEPGGVGSRRRLADASHLKRLRALADAGCVMVSVCTGSLVYAAAGLLRERPATTHHQHLDELARYEPTAQLSTDQRWVDDGTVITGGGVSAGIDLSLHLVARLAGTERARQVQSAIEYFPTPPTLA